MESFKGLDIAITGGAGFIGSHLTEKLLSLGARVAVIDDFLFGSKLEHLRGDKHLSVYDADVRDIKALSQILKNKDMVFHLAAVVGVEETQMDPLGVLDVEIRGTENVLNAAVENKVKKVIFGSSSEVYGDLPEPMSEDDPLAPKSTYAVTKLVGEEYCKAFYHRYSMPYVILRYFNIYGPRQDERFVISRFIRRAVANEAIYIYGDGKQTRDFTYIADAIHMTLLAAAREEASCQAINVGTGVSISVNEMALRVIKMFGNPDRNKPVYVDYDNYRPREVEVFSRTADISKARRLLQCEPRTSLESGLLSTFNLDKQETMTSRTA